MAISLSSFVNNLAKIIQKIHCKDRRDNKKCGVCRSKYEYFKRFLEYTNVYVVTKIIKKILMKI